ncbi:MAG: pyridoxal phosphate-dependent aminotransferase, partial [Nannocystaceae bacterium]
MPTGRSLTAADQRLLIETCQRRGALLVWDGALIEMVHDADPILSPQPGEDHVIRIGTLSKTFGLPGLRVGWALGAPELLKQVEVWKDHTSLYVSPLLERIAQVVIERADPFLNWRRSQVKQNLSVLNAWIETVEDDVESFSPDGGLTIFPRLPRIADVDAFCRKIAQERSVMVVPGSSFGQPQHIRLGFGAPTKILSEGLARLSEALVEGRSRAAATSYPVVPRPVEPVPSYELSCEESAQISA